MMYLLRKKLTITKLACFFLAALAAFVGLLLNNVIVIAAGGVPLGTAIGISIALEELRTLY